MILYVYNYIHTLYTYDYMSNESDWSFQSLPYFHGPKWNAPQQLIWLGWIEMTNWRWQCDMLPSIFIHFGHNFCGNRWQPLCFDMWSLRQLGPPRLLPGVVCHRRCCAGTGGSRTDGRWWLLWLPSSSGWIWGCMMQLWSNSLGSFQYVFRWLVTHCRFAAMTIFLGYCFWEHTSEKTMITPQQLWPALCDLQVQFENEYLQQLLGLWNGRLEDHSVTVWHLINYTEFVCLLSAIGK